MKLEYIETKEKTTEKGDHYIRKIYAIEGYTITVDDVTYNDGRTYHDVSITAPWRNMTERTYIPEIYYHDGFMGSEAPCIQIQTTSYGSMEPEEFKRFVAAQQKALEIAEILTEEFITKQQKEG